MLARSSKNLLVIASAVSVLTTGDPVAVKGSRYDDVSADTQGFAAVFELEATGGTSPTLDAVVETSWDGTTWHTVAEMTQLSGEGTQKEIVTIATIGPRVRTVVTPGGSANPEVTGTVRLVSSGLIG